MLGVPTTWPDSINCNGTILILTMLAPGPDYIPAGTGVYTMGPVAFNLVTQQIVWVGGGGGGPDCAVGTLLSTLRAAGKTSS